MCNQDKKAIISQKLRQAESTLQEAIDQQYAISSEAEASQFFEENTAKPHEAQQIIKRLAEDIAGL